MAGWLLVRAVAAAEVTPPITNADEAFTVDVWETESGLPQNSVIAMIQTRDGYLWLGTLNGLVRFDGMRFTVFDEGNTPGLSSSRIVSLFEDRQGRLWVGTETGGAAVVRDGKVTSLDIGRGTRDGRLLATCEDTSGSVWLYTAAGELCRYREGKVDVWKLGAGRPSKLRALVPRPTGGLWVGTDWSLFTLGSTAELPPRELPVEDVIAIGKLDYLLASRGGGQWRLADGVIRRWVPGEPGVDLGAYPWDSTPVSTACEDQEGNLIVGTLGAGVFWFDAKGHVTRLSKDSGLSHNYILSLTVDREGSLWVGTDGGGLNRVKHPKFQTLPESRGLVAQSVCEDDEGAIWVGYNKGGIDRWRDGNVRRFGPEEGLMNVPVRAVCPGGPGKVWIGTLGAGLLLFEHERFVRPPAASRIHPAILALHRDRQGRLWVGTRGGLALADGDQFQSYTTRDGLSSDVVQAIADDLEGNLWVGTEQGGLNRLRDGRFTVIRKSAHGLPSDAISSLHVDEKGVLWIGTDGGGLARFHQDRWTRYTKGEGLVSNSIGYLIEDGTGHLWLGSNAGLMRTPKEALEAFAAGRTNAVPCRAYGSPDGLPAGECTSGSQPGAAQARSGLLWFPTIKGVAVADPGVLTANLHPPPVAIEAVLIDGVDQRPDLLRTEPPSAVTMSAGKERLEIQYTSLNLAAPDRARFRYRLGGSAWTEAGGARSVQFPRLSPDEYRFEVTASNEDGVWNPVGAILAIVVEPPFWRTWWFLGGTTAFLLGALGGLVYFVSTQQLQRQLERLQQQQALEKERSRIARDLHDQLGASLTQVALLGELAESDKDEPAEVEAHARQISQTARDTTRVLDEIVWAVNPSNDTLDGLITYLCKNAQEYLGVAGLRYRQEIPPQLPALPLPPEVRHNVFLAAKEAVTNIVRHAQASEARMRLHLTAHTFTLEIEDNGRGPAGRETKAAQGRNGLRNMSKRMEDIGGQFDIATGSDGGTLVRLAAPLTLDPKS